jgi:hypothetical protein
VLLISPVTVLAKTTHHGGAAIRSSRAFTRRRSSEAFGNFAAGGIAWLLAAGAYAQTDEIQVYDATINAPGQFSLELHNNYTPIGRKQSDFEGGITTEQGQTALRPLFARRRESKPWSLTEQRITPHLTTAPKPEAHLETLATPRRQ